MSVYSFSQSIRLGVDVGLINERVMSFVESNARKLNDAIDARRTQEFAATPPAIPLCWTRGSISRCARCAIRASMKCIGEVAFDEAF